MLNADSFHSRHIVLSGQETDANVDEDIYIGNNQFLNQNKKEIFRIVVVNRIDTRIQWGNLRMIAKQITLVEPYSNSAARSPSQKRLIR